MLIKYFDSVGVIVPCWNILLIKKNISLLLDTHEKAGKQLGNMVNMIESERIKSWINCDIVGVLIM